MNLSPLTGVLLNGTASGTLATTNRLTNIQVATTAAMAGTLTLSGAGGGTFTTPSALNGVQAVPDLFGPVFYQYSNIADVGLARVSWTCG